MSELNNQDISDTEGTVTIEWDIFDSSKSPKINGIGTNYTAFLKYCKEIIKDLNRHTEAVAQDNRDGGHLYRNIDHTPFLKTCEDCKEAVKYVLSFYDKHHFVRTSRYNEGIYTYSCYTALVNLQFQLHMALESEKNRQRKQEV